RHDAAPRDRRAVRHDEGVLHRARVRPIDGAARRRQAHRRRGLPAGDRAQLRSRVSVPGHPVPGSPAPSVPGARAADECPGTRRNARGVNMASPSPSEVKEPPAKASVVAPIPRKKKAMRAYMLLAGLAGAALAVYFIHGYLTRDEVTTDDAQVDADVVPIAA